MYIKADGLHGWAIWEINNRGFALRKSVCTDENTRWIRHICFQRIVGWGYEDADDYDILTDEEAFMEML